MSWQYFVLAVLCLGVIAELGKQWIKRKRRWAPPRQRFVHTKTQGVYEVLEHGRLEADARPVVIYRNVNSADIWVRDYNEFYDGRFVALPNHNERN